MVGKVGCILYPAKLLVSCLVGSVLKVDLSGAVKKKRATSGFGFKVMLGGSLCFSDPCTLQVYFGAISNLA